MTEVLMPEKQKLTPAEMLAHIRQMRENDQDYVQEAIAAGQDTSDDIDERRFFLGDLGGLIEKDYDTDTFGDWARSIKVPKNTAYEYRDVAAFYENSARAGIREQMPAIGYTHMRIAMKTGNLTEALSFLEECAADSWSTDRAAVEMSKRLTGKEPPKTLLDLTTTSYEIDPARRTVTLRLPAHVDIEDLKKSHQERRLVRFVLKESKA